MPNPNPDSLNEAIGRALQAGDFQTAQRLSADLGAAVRLELAAAPPVDLVALFKRRIGRLQEHLNLARVLRAHLAAQLQTSTTVCRYLDNTARGHSWSFDA